MKSAMIIAAALLLQACSHKFIRDVDYKKYNLYSSENAGNIKYKDFGPVIAENSGNLFSSCSYIIEGALEELLAMTKQKGGNAIVNVKWSKGDFSTPMPTCTTRYGFLLFFPAAFGPWMKVVEVSGTAAYIDPATQGPDETSTNVLLIEEGKSLEEIAKNHVRNNIIYSP